ncbi:hypothetical protein [Planctomicrobium sp. SH527]|uniref:hypothetical protein n=1 Tax=Planctomicrobium sp. SH527 TaxID=3448123 RepID=UPI003F5C1F33
MNTIQTNFIPGLVLGVGLGLMLGHVTVWKSSQPALSKVQVQSSAFPKLEPLLYKTSLYPTPVDGVRLNDALDELELFSQGSPLQNAIAVTTSSEPVSPLTPVATPDVKLVAQLPQSAVDSPDSPFAPQPLPQSKSLVPIETKSGGDEQMIREIIEIELAHLPPEKRRAWYESLKNERKEDAVGILKMWKLVGGPSPDAIPLGPEVLGPGTLPPMGAPGVQPLMEPAPLHPVSPAIDDGLINAKQLIHKENLRFRDTPGYLPLIPYWLSSRLEGSKGELQVKSRPHFKALSQTQTSFPFDLAIDGAGFFTVKSKSGELFYTRNGQFRLNKERKLSLNVGGEEFVLTPEVTIPKSEGGVLIGVAGHVTTQKSTEKSERSEQDIIGRVIVVLPWSSSELVHRGNGLFQIENEFSDSPVPEHMMPWDIETRIKQGSLEIPSINYKYEEACSVER